VLQALEIADFAFDIEVLWRLKRAGFTILEAPTTWSDRREGTKIDVLRSSWGMLRSILRLRLKETLLWRLPLLDRLWHHGIIPVKAQPRVLLLGIRLDQALVERDLGTFVELLRERGIEVTDARRESGREQRASVFDRIRFFAWYAFAIPRDYDALVEVAGRASCIPPLSAKPSFVLASGDPPRRFSAAQMRLYRSSARLDLRERDLTEAVDQVAAAALRGRLYAAFFVGDPGSLALHYVNSGSGTMERHTLQ
jgi:hypothetical protein